MARGSICKRQLDDGSTRYDVIVDLGPDPQTSRRRQRKRTFTTRKEAQAALAAWLTDIDRGAAIDRSTQTVADLLQYWLDHYARHRVSARTLDSYSATVRLHIIPTLGTIPIQKLTPARLQAFYTERITAGCGTRTVELCHLHISQALKQAGKLGWVPRNVADLVTPPRWKPREMDTWNGEEARRFLSVAHESVYGPIWLLALSTGMRKGELLGARWCDLDFERGVLSIRQTVGTLRGRIEIKPPKTAKSRREINLQRAVLDVLRRHRQRQNDHRLARGSL